MKTSEERILQISNDVSEGCVEATKDELIAVVRYWQDRSDRWNDLHQKRMQQFANLMIDHLQQPHP